MDLDPTTTMSSWMKIQKSFAPDSVSVILFWLKPLNPDCFLIIFAGAKHGFDPKTVIPPTDANKAGVGVTGRGAGWRAGLGAHTGVSDWAAKGAYTHAGFDGGRYQGYYAPDPALSEFEGEEMEGFVCGRLQFLIRFVGGEKIIHD